MTQKEKSLLLKDLCARLSYGVKCKIMHSYKHKDKITQDVVALTEISFISPECYFEETDEYEKIENVKLYLRPLSSMTDEEEEEYNIMSNYNNSPTNSFILVDWLNAHHFDYRGLIKKGLALEAPEEMYNIKQK